MPFINCQTNISISAEQAQNVKTRLGKAIELVPGKTEKWLMVSLIDDCSMFFQGKSDTPIAMVQLMILVGDDDTIDYNPVSKEIITIINEELAIPADKIYVTFAEYRNWGGKNGDSYLF